MKNLKRVIALLLTMALAFACVGAVSAAELSEKETPEIQPRFTYLGTPTISFAVRAAHGVGDFYVPVVNDCSKVTIDVTLQYLNGSSWQDVANSRKVIEVDTHGKTAASAQYMSPQLYNKGYYRMRVTIKGHWGIFWETKEYYSAQDLCQAVA